MVETPQEVADQRRLMGLDLPFTAESAAIARKQLVAWMLELDAHADHRHDARLVLGGARPEGLSRGYFVAPTIFDCVPPDTRIAREEVFGPVVTVTRFATEAEALAIANGTGYGLVAGVYTQDISRALRLARALEAGSVWINGWFIGGQQAPTGGIKDSGVGRERGLPGIRNYLSIKNVGIRL